MKDEKTEQVYLCFGKHKINITKDLNRTEKRVVTTCDNPFEGILDCLSGKGEVVEYKVSLYDLISEMDILIEGPDRHAVARVFIEGYEKQSEKIKDLIKKHLVFNYCLDGEHSILK